MPRANSHTANLPLTMAESVKDQKVGRFGGRIVKPRGAAPSDNDAVADCPIEPLIRLWHAAVNQAWEDIDGNDAVVKKSAIDWFLSDNRDRGSFLWVCETTSLNEVLILRKVKRHLAHRTGRSCGN